MSVTVRSFAKINIGLLIGHRRGDGFHELRTVYHTIALHDLIRVDVLRPGAKGKAGRQPAIEIVCDDHRVPLDASNTCWRMAERVMRFARRRERVRIEITKRLPVQGGLGAASGNGVAVMLALERALKTTIPHEKKLEMAAEVGSDLPLFCIGGAVLGVGRGEQVYPLPELPAIPLVVATPRIAVSTPQAFKEWDRMVDGGAGGGKLTHPAGFDRIERLSRSQCAWWSGLVQPAGSAGGPTSGVPRGKDRGDRAEALLLDLVRTGIENDFERVVFSEYPELSKVKRVLERQGAKYASLSGSGSSVYGLFASAEAARRAAAALCEAGIPAQATRTLSRTEYWKRMF